ncbi:MAG: PilZ domain-containing protein [Archangiaceae bacterium]|nr:PilZ domain-containing protein [Archangiaceae bacterium]
MPQSLFRNADRRRDPRVGARFEVSFQTQEAAAKAFKTFSVNFSAGGLCLRSSRQHDIGEVVQLHLTIEKESFEIKGTVQWARADVVGVRFVDLQPTLRDRLRALARTMIESGSPIVDD